MQQAEGGGRAGISISALLKITSERLIANNVMKLRSLLNELRDHEVVIQRNAADGGTLFHLPYDDKIVQRLKEGASLSNSEEEEEDDAEDSDS